MPGGTLGCCWGGGCSAGGAAPWPGTAAAWPSGAAVPAAQGAAAALRSAEPSAASAAPVAASPAAAASGEAPAGAAAAAVGAESGWATRPKSSSVKVTSSSSSAAAEPAPPAPPAGSTRRAPLFCAGTGGGKQRCRVAQRSSKQVLSEGTCRPDANARCTGARARARLTALSDCSLHTTDSQQCGAGRARGSRTLAN